MLTEQNIEAFLSNDLVGTAYLWAPVACFASGYWLTRREHAAITILTSLLLGFTAFVFCFGFTMAWALKDGLAPGMEVTHGDEAVAQFTGLLKTMLFIGAALLLVAFLPWLFAHFVRRRRQFLTRTAEEEREKGPKTILDSIGFLIPPVFTTLVCSTYSETQAWPYLLYIGGFTLIWSGVWLLLCAGTLRFKSVGHAWLLGCAICPLLTIVVLTIDGDSRF